MDYYEAEGKSLEEALESISKEHGVAVEDLVYEVVENKRKLLGILGKENVLVRAWPKTTSGMDPEDVCNRLMHLAGISADARRVNGQQGEEGVHLELKGGDLDLILKRNGELLDAIQYLTNKIVNRGCARPVHVILDSDGFRERKRQRLEEMAVKAAEQVRAQGRSVVLDPMSPQDRRIIHVTLKDHENVTTKSVGNGYFKKVMVVLKRSPSRTRRKS